LNVIKSGLGRPGGLTGALSKCRPAPGQRQEPEGPLSECQSTDYALRQHWQ
jgi:hypothetical protein